jgi:hypothetical protein
MSKNARTTNPNGSIQFDHFMPEEISFGEAEREFRVGMPVTRTRPMDGPVRQYCMEGRRVGSMERGVERSGMLDLGRRAFTMRSI